MVRSASLYVIASGRSPRGNLVAFGGSWPGDCCHSQNLRAYAAM